VRVLIKVLRAAFFYPLEVIDALFLFAASHFSPKKIDVLFICHEADLGLYFRGSFLSRLIDPAAISLQAADFFCEKYLWQRVTRTGLLHSSYNKRSLRLIFSNTFTATLFLRYVLSPRLIVSIPVSACLKKASDSLGIPTLEPFHGFGIGPRDHMWRTDQYVQTGTHFIAYDDQTVQTLLANQHRYYDVVRCSHPYLAVNQRLHRNLPSPFVRGGKCFSYAYQEREVIDNELSASLSDCVLITLQHGYDGSHPLFQGILPNGFMHESLISVIKQRSDLKWIIRPHPVQMSSSRARQKLFSFLDKAFSDFPNVFYQTCHLFDPVDLLRLSSLHITMMSSAVVEAYLLGVHSICLCPTFRRGGAMETAFDLVRKNGFLHHVSLEEALISDSISHLICSRATRDSSYQQFCDRESAYPSLAQVCASLLQVSI
jgi:hypothetical protein